MLIKNTYVVGIFSLIYVAATSLSLVWVVYRIAVSGDQLTSRIQTIANTDAKQKANKDLAKLLVSTEVERATLDSFLLTEDATSNFLTEIEHIARLQGVALTTNSLDVVKPSKKAISTSTDASAMQSSVAFQQLTVQFAVEGSETGVMKMLEILENLPYHSQVTAFLLNRKTIGVAKSTISMNITLQK